MQSEVVTPLIRQYLEIKKDFQDSILFFRLGDFYEMFFEDAQKAAKVLNIALTSRDKRSENPVPLCGVPYHSADGYISKLLDTGHKVAICEQVEDPKDAKGIVRREVVRVITPGLRTDQEGLAPKEQSRLVSIAVGKTQRGDKGQLAREYALSWLDIASLRFEVCHTTSFQELSHEIRRLSPKEILIPENIDDSELSSWLGAYASQTKNLRLEKLPSATYEQAERKICERFSVHALEGLGFEKPSAMAQAASAVLHYVEDMNRRRLQHLSAPKPYHWATHLYMDASSREHLEISDLFECLDETVTSMGSRKLKDWMHFPLRDVKAIEQRLNCVQELKDEHEIRETLRRELSQVYDLERLITRVIGERASARDLVALRETLKQARKIKETLKSLRSENLARIEKETIVNETLLGKLNDTLVEDPPVSVKEGGMIQQGVHAELDEYRNIGKASKEWLSRLESQEKQRTGIATLKVGYNRVFGYFLEVTKSHLSKVPSEYERRQTLTNAERYVTPALKEYESKILGAQEKIQQLEYELFENLRQEVTDHFEQLKGLAEQLSLIDVYINLSRVASRYGYVRPVPNESSRIQIVNGRHPVVERALGTDAFVPNSLELNEASQQLIILTGPNMAGKSTIMRQMAIIVYMAQLGSFVPAEQASIGVVDRIFTRVGASDDLAGGRSTFMVEMNETANILRNATKDSLVILDEIGRGTSTFDGLAIAWAVAEDLHDRVKCKTIFATHYHELTELALTKPRVKNMNVAVKEWQNQIIFVRKLVDGAVNRSYGIEVARLAGVLSHVIDRAKQVLASLEKESHQVNVPPATTPQLTLFQALPSKLEKELMELDVHEITPMQALQLLESWQKHYRNS